MTKSAPRMATLRARRKEQGLQEVRGIWAPVDMHERIKQAAQKEIARPIDTAKNKV